MGENITEEYWSRFPDTYDKKMEYVVGKELRDAVIQELNRLPELGEIVELGCGTGIFTETIALKTKSMATSFPSQAIDSVFMANLIHVVESTSTLLQECYRVLREGGTIVSVHHFYKPVHAFDSGYFFHGLFFAF